MDHKTSQLMHRQLEWVRAISREIDRLYPIEAESDDPFTSRPAAPDSLTSFAPSSAASSGSSSSSPAGPTRSIGSPLSQARSSYQGDEPESALMATFALISSAGAAATGRAEASESLPKGCTREKFEEILRKALKSPFPAVRKGAASALGKFARSFSGWGSLDLTPYQAPPERAASSERSAPAVGAIASEPEPAGAREGSMARAGTGVNETMVRTMTYLQQATKMIVLVLDEMVEQEKNPQARQYVIKALAKYGVNAVLALKSLKDAARDLPRLNETLTTKLSR